MLRQHDVTVLLCCHALLCLLCLLCLLPCFAALLCLYTHLTATCFCEPHQSHIATNEAGAEQVGLYMQYGGCAETRVKCAARVRIVRKQ